MGCQVTVDGYEALSSEARLPRPGPETKKPRDILHVPI